VNQPTAAPTNKVLAGAFVGAVTTVILWAIEEFTPIKMPSNIGAAISTILAFVASYIIPEADPPAKVETVTTTTTEKITPAPVEQKPKP
jgi:hypothetical protein